MYVYNVGTDIVGTSKGRITLPMEYNLKNLGKMLTVDGGQHCGELFCQRSY